jgi:hypothetical protein
MPDPVPVDNGRSTPSHSRELQTWQNLVVAADRLTGYRPPARCERGNGSIDHGYCSEAELASNGRLPLLAFLHFLSPELIVAVSGGDNIGLTLGDQLFRAEPIEL